jgi:hypothetical protein
MLISSRIAGMLAGAALALAICQAAMFEGGEKVLGEGTPVLLAFAQNLSSKSAVTGDRIEFILAHDLTVGGQTVKAGTRASGHVSHVKGATAPGRSGALSIQLDYLEARGAQVLLRPSRDKGPSNEVQYSKPYRLKWPMGLFRTGDDVEIARGTVLAAYVDRDTTIEAQE